MDYVLNILKDERYGRHSMDQNNKNQNLKLQQMHPLQAEDQSGRHDHLLVADASTELQQTLTAVRMMAGFVIAALLIAALYFGKDILIPLALAILLAFLLSPLVAKFKKWGCPQWAAIALVMSMTLALLGGASAYLGVQLGHLSQELPQYHDTIKQKLHSVKDYSQGPSIWDGALKTLETVENSMKSTRVEQDDPNIQNVKVVGEGQTTQQAVLEWMGKILNPLAVIGIVFLFVILILINGKDLHDRFLKLLGGNLNIGTDALDDAATRIGTYLRMQLLVNVSYGIPMAIGLWLIGVPAAIMWGMVAIAMRFVPYVGPMVCAIFPITLAFAVDPTWNMVLWTIGLIVVLELISNNVIEPWLYGESTGLSTLSIILAATFWTTVWGPIGLILSTPLTACLLVLSHYIPALQFIKTLIGNEPVLSPAQRFYQRLVADDVDDAMQVANDFIHTDLPKNPSDEVIARRVTTFYEDVAIPAIRIYSQGHNTEVTAEHRLRLHHGLKFFNHAIQTTYPSSVQQDQPEVLCIGARWEIDAHLSAMLAHAMNLRGISAQSRAQVMIQAAQTQADSLPASVKVLCISIFHQTPTAQIRLLKQKLSAQYPSLKVIYAVWGGTDVEILDELKQRLDLDACVNSVNELMWTLDAWRLKVGESWIEQLDMPNQAERIQALYDLDVLDEDLHSLYMQYIEEVRQAFDVKYAQISWVNQDAVYTPASQLAKETEQPMQTKQAHQDSICTYLVNVNEDLIIEDLHRDPRFSHLAELSQNKIRFYAGVPLRLKNGIALGSLCILDKQPKQMQEDDMLLLNEIAQDLMETMTNTRKKKNKQEQIEEIQPSSDQVKQGQEN